MKGNPLFQKLQVSIASMLRDDAKTLCSQTPLMAGCLRRR